MGIADPDTLFQDFRRAAEAGDWAAALAPIARLAALFPGEKQPHAFHGQTLDRLGRPADAAAAYAAALALDPDWRAVRLNRAMALVGAGDLSAAADELDRIQPGPDLDAELPRARRRLAVARMERLSAEAVAREATGDVAGAVEAFAAALRIDPAFLPALIGLGQLCDAAGLPGPARDCATAALEVAPDQGATRLLAGLVALADRDWPRARAHLVVAGSLLEDPLPALAGRLRVGLEAADLAGRPALVAEVRAALDRGAALPPFALLHLDLDDDSLRANARRWSARVPMPLSLVAPSRTPTDRLPRVAFVSADFRRHPMARAIAPVLEARQPADGWVGLYSVGPDDGDPLRARLAAAADAFVDLNGQDDASAAHRIAADAPDIVIDLMGWTAGQRQPVLAHRPAPLIAHWIGYPDDPMAPWIDVVVADRVTAPDGWEAGGTPVVRLNGCYFPGDPQRPRPRAIGRAAAGLPDDAVVLATLVALPKLDPDWLTAVGEAMRAVPATRLWLLAADDAEATASLRAALARLDVAPERLLAAPRRAEAEHLDRLALADLFLDCWPYGAHTTALEALWCGVPVVTRLGDRFAGRVAASMLASAGLGEFVARDRATWTAMVVGLARDAGRRQAARDRLSAAVADAPLFDCQGRLAELVAKLVDFGSRRVLPASP
jgi:tetratricopeptide (TPR) repeat protein